MRFLIIFIGLICLSPFTSGCIGNQGRISNQEHTPTEDEQTAISIEDAIDTGEKPPSEDSQIEDHILGDGQQGSTPTDLTVDEAQEHYLAFFSLLKTDQEAAIAELSEYVKLRFGTHSLADKWIKLANRLLLDGKGTFLDMKHYTEWHLQMLMDVEPEKRTAAHTKLLEIHQNAVQQIEMIGKTLEQQGKNLETYEMPAQFITQ